MEQFCIIKVDKTTIQLNNSMKKLNSLFFAFAAIVIGFTSCIEGNDKPTPNPGPEENDDVLVTSNISSNTTWETGKTYILGGRISVTSGNTLTIQPGVVVKGEVGTGSNATALIIARGAKIDAQGTASSPIIFTTVADEIEPGQIVSPNLEPNLSGLWGGLIVLGNAKGSFAGDVTEIQIEGIPPSDTNGLYGGSDDEDNSGVLKYISIRHGGANIGEGNEINGLTLGGVGSQTVIENVEVIGNQDDGIEWFGGTVNVKNALIWNAGDDALDTDQAWAGTLDNFIVITGGETDHALEIDGPEGSYNAGHTLKNGSIKGNDVSEFGDFRDGARGTFENIYFFGFADPTTTDGRGDLSLSGDKTLATFADGSLKFMNLEATLAEGVDLETVFKAGTVDYATAVAAGANTVGADKSVFTAWSWAEVAGELADF
ncbi:putative outer membrane lipoprotein [Algoriphagus machipongonensis]|uniref:Outer membrane lipoprotein n=2 Tax=Algoriphagus machipongonensis TaxID=388413 RepID=A3HTY9_9BACT|nr:putative outer membrane lipoprotein [Algoriphagus machipongonensis]